MTGGPLQGEQVLDLTRAFGGPLCTMILGEMGARVVKIEDPNGGDETRTWPVKLGGGLSTYFATLNRNKESLTLNLKSDEGRAIVLALAARSGVFVENFTPGVADRLGIGYEAVRAVRPDVVYCSISGFGQTGPYRTRKGYDPILQAMGGLMGVTGEKGGGPIKSMIPVADISAGLAASNAILAALVHRDKTGEGQYLDLSMMDVMVSLTSILGTAVLNGGPVPPRSGTENPVRVPSAAFECSDGKFLQLVPNQRQWATFCAVIGAPEFTEDERFVDNIARIRNQESLYPRLRAIFRTRTATEWENALLEAGIPAGQILLLDELFENEQVRAREMVFEYDHPTGGPVRAINLPFRLSRSPVQMHALPPDLGADTERILEELGRTPEEIGVLRRVKVI